MENHFVKITHIDYVTHDTLRIITEKPANYTFVPGQATDIVINKTGWLTHRRPFTITSLPTDPYIEFIIKTYPAHDGATDKLLDMKAGDELILHEIFGSLKYKGEGVFIAGGAGVTPFLAMLRDLKKNNVEHNNVMFFGNKTRADIILGDELDTLLNGRMIHVFSEEEAAGYAHGYITRELLEKHITDFQHNYFYFCGPMPMMKSIEQILGALGVPAKKMVREGW